MNPTRATPIISADAVAAVRLGLRRALFRAYLPVTPNSRVGTPSSPTAGPTSTGPRVNTPRTIVIAPSPISGRPSWPDADRPMANDATPAPVSSRPKAARQNDAPERSTATSRRAAIGRTRLARTAGTTPTARSRPRRRRAPS